MEEEDEPRRLRSRNARRLGAASHRTCLIAEAVCGSALIAAEESRQLCAAARLLREAARLRRTPPETD